MNYLAFAQLILGLMLLTLGAEALVRGAARLAAALGVSPLIIGLTVVAFGTSSPELAVSVIASLDQQMDISVGNVVGSNIFNILFILGVSAMVAPLTVATQIIRLDVPLMILASVLVLAFGWDKVISLWEGGVLFAGIFAYIAFLIYTARKEYNQTQEFEREFGRLTAFNFWAGLWNCILVGLGLGLLVLGSRWLVDGAAAVARSLGVSELVIGLTIVAAGTSLPELATSVVASLRGERDISVGNIVGSNIFNLLAVLGGSALASFHGLIVSESALRFDIPVMIAAAFACWPVFYKGFDISRWEGAAFVLSYFAYVGYLILAALRPEIVPMANSAMLFFVLPLTLLTLAVVLWQGICKQGLPHRALRKNPR
ncbi:MAG: calcium/sodium antiporter [Methylohalobius sp.]